MDNTNLIAVIEQKLLELENTSAEVKLYRSLNDTLQAFTLSNETGKKESLKEPLVLLSSNTVVKNGGNGLSNKKKVANIFKEAGRFLHMREILEIAKSKEPNVLPDLLKMRTQQAVYALRNDNVIVGYSVNESNLNVFWGSKTWINSDGSPKEENMYNENQLSGKMKESIEI